VKDPAEAAGCVEAVKEWPLAVSRLTTADNPNPMVTTSAAAASQEKTRMTTRESDGGWLVLRRWLG
jgi:hypothetical protein